jgi:hypothetical protein
MSRSARGLYAAWNIRRRETLRLPHAVHICKLPLLLRGSDDPCYATSRISLCLSQLCTLLHFHDIDPVSASHAPPLTCLTWCTSNSSACSSAGYHPVPPPVACGFELARAYIRASRWDVWSVRCISKKPVEYIVQCSQDSQDSPVANPLVCSHRRELQTATKCSLVTLLTIISLVAP